MDCRIKNMYLDYFRGYKFSQSEEQRNKGLITGEYRIDLPTAGIVHGWFYMLNGEYHEENWPGLHLWGPIRK